MLFVVGAIVTPLQASIATLSQTSVADEVRGRIGASLNALITTASLISMALAGVLGDLIGVHSVFVVAGGISICAGLAARRSSGRGQARRLSPRRAHDRKRKA
jgi:MFS family permease